MKNRKNGLSAVGFQDLDLWIIIVRPSLIHQNKTLFQGLGFSSLSLLKKNKGRNGEVQKTLSKHNKTSKSPKREIFSLIIIMEKKFYLTKEGLEKIQREFDDLKKLRLLKTADDVPKIWHSEDLNPEYITFQEDLGLLEARIDELEHILDNSEVIKAPSKDKQDVLDIGATVLVDVNGQRDEYRIVGTLEANPALGRISNESPVGRNLLGHKVGDEIVVNSPVEITFKILKIRYS